MDCFVQLFLDEWILAEFFTTDYVIELKKIFKEFPVSVNQYVKIYVIEQIFQSMVKLIRACMKLWITLFICFFLMNGLHFYMLGYIFTRFIINNKKREKIVKWFCFKYSQHIVTNDSYASIPSLGKLVYFMINISTLRIAAYNI